MKIIILLALLSTQLIAAPVQTGDQISAKKFNSSTYIVGDIRTSLLDEATLQSNVGTCWVKMRGQDVSVSDYGALKKASSGNSNLVVYLPNSTNLFLRDTGAGVGQVQQEDWKSFHMTNTVMNGTAYSHGPVYMGKTTTSYTGNIFAGRWATPSAAIGLMWDSSEVRPVNMGVNYYIKINHECN